MRRILKNTPSSRRNHQHDEFPASHERGRSEPCLRFGRSAKRKSAAEIISTASEVHAKPMILVRSCRDGRL